MQRQGVPPTLHKKSKGSSPVFVPALFSIFLHLLLIIALLFGQTWMKSDPKKRPEYRHIKAKVVQMDSKNNKKQVAKKQEKKRKELEAKKKAAEKKRKEAERLALKKKQEAEKKRLAEKKKKAAEEKRLLALKKKKEKEEKEKQERLAKEKAEKLKKQKEEEKRLAELKKKKQEEEKRKQKEKERKARELERQKLEEQQLLAELAAEEQAIQQDLSDEQAAMGYIDVLREEIYQAWRLPPYSDPELVVGVRIRLVPTGEVISVAIINSSGNEVLDRSVEQAVKRASPLSVPKESRIFEKHFRSILINFRPVGV